MTEDGKNRGGMKNDESKPNILFIMTDQHNADYLGCLGRPELHTPNLDKLAGQSAVFHSAYTPSPICGPARTAVFAGAYPLQTGIFQNWIPLADESALLTHQLARAGYYNAMIGKLHISPAADMHGFHFRRLCDSPHDVYDRSEVESNDYLPWASKGLGVTAEHLAELAGESERCGPHTTEFWKGWEWIDDAHQMTTWTGNEAVSFIRGYDQPQPFFAHISFFGPHHPYASCEPWDSMCDVEKITLPPTLHMDRDGEIRGSRFDWPDEQWRDIIAKYAGNISAIDVQVGRILSALKERGLWENTLIVFTADHGDHMGDYAMLGKGTMLESSVRVPFFIKPPGAAMERRDYAEVVSLIDLYPTFMDYAGVTDRRENSRSLCNILHSNGVWQNQTFASFCSPDGRDGQVMFIKDKLKAVGFLKDGEITTELYDRTADVPDLCNLAGDPVYAESVRTMNAELKAWILAQLSKSKSTHTVQHG